MVLINGASGRSFGTGRTATKNANAPRIAQAIIEPNSAT